MQVVQSVSGKFHHFHLARQLHQRQMLAAIFSSYPDWKLKTEDIPPALLRTFPAVHLLALGSGRLSGLGRQALWQFAHWDRVTFDRYVARNMPECDVFVGLSGSALLSGRTAQSRGAKYLCDRGSSHIRWGDQMMQAEFRRWGQEYETNDPRIVAQEEAEYAQADLITVPSEFARRTFLEMGVPAAKIKKVPYGADLSRFARTGDPALDAFDVLFVGHVSFRKGVPDLLEAFQKFQHPKKMLTLIGGIAPEMQRYLHGRHLPNIEFTGPLPHNQLKERMSRSHVMVLPSVEEGLALVQGEAMACGCPIIASENTGSADLFTDGQEGFIVPIRDPTAITERLEQLAQNPELRAQMSDNCGQRVAQIGGWDTYGAQMRALLIALAAGELSAVPTGCVGT